jgi:hypothetical protein
MKGSRLGAPQASLKRGQRVTVTADCYVRLPRDSTGTVTDAWPGESIVRFDVDGSRRLIINRNLRHAR